MFLTKTGLVTAAALLPVSAFSQGRWSVDDNALDPENISHLGEFTAETFEKWVGSRFRISLNGNSLGTLLLAGVEKIDTSAAGKDAPSGWVGRRILPAAGVELTMFNLKFKRTGTQLAQGTYLLDHDWLGKFPLLLVPGGPHGVIASFVLLNKKDAA
jgi:hypothetical protein